jgi:hypothetical protein
MNVTIINNGEHPIRVIVDHDTVNDMQVEAHEELSVDASGGIIELRELDMDGEEAEQNPDDDGHH